MAMMTRLKMVPLLALLTLQVGAAAPRTVTIVCMPGPWIVYFPRGSAELDETSHNILANFNANRVGCETGKVSVEGYTDTNERTAVSVARANAVERYLIGLGIPPKQMRAYGKGATNLRVRTPPHTDEPQNRRVEVSLWLPDTVFPAK